MNRSDPLKKLAAIVVRLLRLKWTDQRPQEVQTLPATRAVPGIAPVMLRYSYCLACVNFRECSYDRR